MIEPISNHFLERFLVVGAVGGIPGGAIVDRSACAGFPFGVDHAPEMLVGGGVTGPERASCPG